MPDTAELFAAMGMRATPQRIAIYETLLPRKDHPTVETLYHDLQNQYPTMSLNTVYTTLIALEKSGLIRRIDAGDGKSRFDGNPKIHAHVVCETCSRVDDVSITSGPIMPVLMHEAATTSGYTIDDGAVYFYGRCSKCSRGLPNEETDQSREKASGGHRNELKGK